MSDRRELELLYEEVAAPVSYRIGATHHNICISKTIPSFTRHEVVVAIKNTVGLKSQRFTYHLAERLVREVLPGIFFGKFEQHRIVGINPPEEEPEDIFGEWGSSTPDLKTQLYHAAKSNAQPWQDKTYLSVSDPRGKEILELMDRLEGIANE